MVKSPTAEYIFRYLNVYAPATEITISRKMVKSPIAGYIFRYPNVYAPAAEITISR